MSNNIIKAYLYLPLKCIFNISMHFINTLGSRYRAGPDKRPPFRDSLSGRTRYRATLNLFIRAR
jgi:hypothetical protein